MANKKVLTTIRLDADQAGRLRALSIRTGVPAASLVRRGVEHVLTTAPVDPYAVLALGGPGFVASLSEVERAALAIRLGLLPTAAVAP